MDKDTAKEILINSLPVYLERKGINPNRKFHCLCPDHADNDPSMGYDKKRNICHCFSCGTNANIFRLIEWDYHVDSFHDAFCIGCDLFGLDTGQEKREIPEMKPVKGKKRAKKEPEKAPVETCDRVYTAMRNLLPLMDADRKYLKEIRGLSEDRINTDYFRLDSANQDTIIKNLKRIGSCSDQELKTVPGFYVNREGNLSYCNEKGIAILIRDADGKACAVQIRRDTAEKGRRYTWFSSSFAHGGTSPGAAKDVLIPAKPRKCLCITEGRFKAEILQAKGNMVISVQGVSTWKGTDRLIAKIRKKYEVRTVCLMFDSDVMGNLQLLRTLKDMADLLTGKFPDLRILSGIWTMEMGKGIDDCYFNGHCGEVRYMEASRFFDQCLATAEAMLKEKKINSLKAVAGEERKTFKTRLQTENENLFFPDICRRTEEERKAEKTAV